MKPQTIQKRLETMTLDEIEQQVLQVETILENIAKKEYEFFVVDFFCNECFTRWNKDIQNSTDENEIADEECPNCYSDNVNPVIARW